MVKIVLVYIIFISKTRILNSELGLLNNKVSRSSRFYLAALNDFNLLL